MPAGPLPVLADRHRDGNPIACQGRRAWRRPFTLSADRVRMRYGDESATGEMFSPSCRNGCTSGCRGWRAKASSGPTRSSPASARPWRSSPATRRVEKANGDPVLAEGIPGTRLGGGVEGSPLDHLPGRRRLRPRTGRPADGNVALDARRREEMFTSRDDRGHRGNPRKTRRRKRQTGTRGLAAGFTLEFDAARKIAQGLGIHLDAIESASSRSRAKGPPAAVAERTGHLFGKDAEAGPPPARRRRRRSRQQRSLFQESGRGRGDGRRLAEPERPAARHDGLDRLHQAMILFGASAANC